MFAYYIYLEFKYLQTEMGDALSLDGVSCRRIPLSLSRAAVPALGTVAGLLFITNWNNWFAGVLLIHRKRLEPSPTFVRSLFLTDTSTLSLGVDHFNMRYPDQILLAVVSAVIPLLIGSIIIYRSRRIS